MADSYIIVRRKTGKPIAEIYSRSTADAVNRDHFEVMTAHAWLARYNALVKAAGGVEPSTEAFLSAIEPRETKQ